MPATLHADSAGPHPAYTGQNLSYSVSNLTVTLAWEVSPGFFPSGREANAAVQRDCELAGCTLLAAGKVVPQGVFTHLGNTYRLAAYCSGVKDGMGRCRLNPNGIQGESLPAVIDEF